MLARFVFVTCWVVPLLHVGLYACRRLDRKKKRSLRIFKYYVATYELIASYKLVTSGRSHNMSHRSRTCQNSEIASLFISTMSWQYVASSVFSIGARNVPIIFILDVGGNTCIQESFRWQEKRFQIVIFNRVALCGLFCSPAGMTC